MRNFRYCTSGSWFKGNTHLHSVASDGGKTFAELAALYASAGYDFLYRTDHWVCSDTSADSEASPLLWLDGIELDGKDEAGQYYHVVCLGSVVALHREDGFAAGLEAAREQGALLVLAHPHWCGNSPEACLEWKFDGVEIYNHVCHWLNGKSSGFVHWEATLRDNPDTLAFAVDDAHLSPEHTGWDGGWIMVNAAACTRQGITNAIRCGNYYSTCGPELRAMEWDGDVLHASTSPVQFARLVGPGYRGARLGSFDGQVLTEVSFTVPEAWDYAYLEVEDSRGRRAWTNTLFTATAARAERSSPLTNTTPTMRQ